MPIFNFKSEFKRDQFQKLLEEAQEKDWTVKFEKVRQARSLSQNRYYWALLTIFGIETGCTPDEMHADMKRAYGLWYKKNGKAYMKSTGTLNTKEMTDYIEYIRNEMAKGGIDRLKTSGDYIKEHWVELQDHFDRNKQNIGAQSND